MAIVISFLGVGMVAIPTGIISAGFVEQYTKLKRLESLGEENELRYVTSTVKHGHSYIGKKISDVVLPPDLLLAAIIRGNEVIVPEKDVEYHEKDVLILGSKHYKNSKDIEIKELLIKGEHPWIGKKISNLDISRLDIIVMIYRNGKSVIPTGSTVINADDTVIVYSKRPG